MEMEKEKSNVSRRLKKISFELLKYKREESECKNKIKELQKELIAGMSNDNVDSFGYKMKNGGYGCNFRLVKPKKVIFDIDKLSEKLDKETFNEVVIKEYKINDFNGIVKLLKRNGVKPSEFKRYIFVDRKVDQKRIDEMSELGLIKMEDIDGTYTVSEGEGYIRVSEYVLEE